MNSGILKPLSSKAYGHIPHLPGSRMGPSDHHCHDGQRVICTERKRDKHDIVTVTCKVDGSCMAVARIDGVVVPLGRSGYPAQTSKYEQHQLFFQWAMERQGRFLELLRDGERICGEWLAQAHGTRYHLRHEPFCPFDLMRGAERAPYAEMVARVAVLGFTVPTLLLGHPLGEPVSVDRVMEELESRYHGELDAPEGAVWRVERKGVFDFMAKYVRPDKVDGCFLPEVSNLPAIWNWRP